MSKDVIMVEREGVAVLRGNDGDHDYVVSVMGTAEQSVLYF